jgi:predicted MFS family arabinose efflux permease
MTSGIIALIGAYVLSQFYRACLAVMAPVLATDIGATAEDLANASGVWFLTFAAMQIPVGWALDRVGPRWTCSVLLAAGAGVGAVLFALATGPAMVIWAMALIGIGCAPVLMGSYYLFARTLPAARFGTMAGIVLGIGTLGNIASSVPLAWAIEVVGWRQTFWVMAAVTFGIAGMAALLLRAPPRLISDQKGSVLSLLAMPALWPILVMMGLCYMPVAALRGLWVGPYYSDVFGADTARIGQITLIMGIAMVLGTFAFGPLERYFRTRKGLILAANLISALAFSALWLFPTAGGWTTLALVTLVGLAGTSFPMVIAHGRAFVPPHLIGRGVTLLNLFGIVSVGIAQIATGRLHASIAPVPPEAPYAAIFLALAVATFAGCAVYSFSRDRTD